MDYKNKPIGGSLRHNYSLCGLTGEGMAGTGFFTRARWQEQDFKKLHDGRIRTAGTRF
jgi:hypothetical protein